MTNPANRSGQTPLRRCAEEKALQEKEPPHASIEGLSSEELKKMLHELRIHQIEVEMQNEELRRIQEELGAANDRYFDLYNLAPVAYCTLSEKGLITEANLAALSLFGMNRSQLVDQPLTTFILTEDQDLYYLLRKQMVAICEPQACELRMVKQDGTVFWVQIATTCQRQGHGSLLYRVTLTDMTKHKQVEETLRVGEEGYRNLLQDVSSVAVQGYGPDGTLQYWNHASEQLYGYSAKEALGRNLLDLKIGSEMREEVERAIRQMAETGHSVPASEWSFMRKDGSRVEVYSSHTVIKVPGRRPELFCIDIDLTKLKQAVRALAESETKYRTLADSGQALIWTGCRDMLFDYINEPWLRFTGRTQAQELGKGWMEGVHPEDRACCLQIYGSAFEKHEPFCMEYRLRHASGEYRWIQGVGTPFFNDQGNCSGYIGHCLDITDRKQADMQLLQAKELYRSLVENSHGIISIFRPDGVVTYLSPSFTRLLGLDPEVLVGQHFSTFVHPDDLAACEAFEKEILRTGKVQRGLEYRVFHRDGSLRWHLANFIPCFNEEKEIVSFVGTAMDITEQKHYQAELDAARAAAEAGSRAKSDFLAMISHEIRTPLNALVGFGALARKSTDAGLLQEYLDILDHSSRMLMDLVNNILDMSKIDAGQLGLESIPFNLSEAVDLLVWQYAPLAEQKKVAFHITKEEGVPQWVEGDPVRLRQILANLITNALKFTESGSIALTVTATPSTREEKRFLLRFEVRDTGIGIAEDKLIELFQPFHQIDPSITRKYGGTGLGLAIVQRLVKLMQGKIDISTEEGSGSCFAVELPFTVSKPPAYKRLEPALAPVSILVVEDNVFNRRYLVDILTNWDHRVTQAEDAVQALEFMERFYYDLVILDLRMPGMDGIELTDRLRSLEKNRNVPPVPVIVCTADSEAMTKEQCLAAGMQCVLSKPIDLDKLADAIRACCCGSSGVKNQTSVEPVSVTGLTDRIVADMGYDSAQLQVYLQLLGEDIHQELEWLNQAFGTTDRSLLKRAAHSLKGLCGHLKNPLPVELAQRLSEGAQELPFTELGYMVKLMDSMCRQLVLKE